MSLLARTPIWNPSTTTDLARAFHTHMERYRSDGKLALSEPEPEWLNAVRYCGGLPGQSEVRRLTDEMYALLMSPSGFPADFAERFTELYERCGRLAYPVSWAIRDAQRAIASETRDYTLQCFDPGMVRILEDEARTDAEVRSFLDEMLRRLRPEASHPPLSDMPAIFEVYSEALVYHVLKERGQGRLTLRKINDSSKSNPDFECRLKSAVPGREGRELHFFVEVKTLNVVGGESRLQHMRDDALDAQVELERQTKQGRAVASTVTPIQPYRQFVKNRGPDLEYDPYSVRGVINTLISKADSAFKAQQFESGPTFALASLLRLPLPGQGKNTLAPFFYDPGNGGACVSGVLWHVAFGTKGAPVHRSPEFEGGGTENGFLDRFGLLADPGRKLQTPALIFFGHLRSGYGCQGLYDAEWTAAGGGWSNPETEEVLNILCEDFNDRENAHAYKYAYHVRP